MRREVLVQFAQIKKAVDAAEQMVGRTVIHVIPLRSFVSKLLAAAAAGMDLFGQGSELEIDGEVAHHLGYDGDRQLRRQRLQLLAQAGLGLLAELDIAAALGFDVFVHAGRGVRTQHVAERLPRVAHQRVEVGVIADHGFLVGYDPAADWRAHWPSSSPVQPGYRRRLFRSCAGSPP